MSSSQLKIRTVTAPAEHMGHPLDLGFNSRHLFDALRLIPTQQIAFFFEDGLTMVELRPLGANDALARRFVLMPTT